MPRKVLYTLLLVLSLIDLYFTALRSSTVISTHYWAVLAQQAAFNFIKGLYFGKACVFRLQLISRGSSFTLGGVPFCPRLVLLGWKSALGVIGFHLRVRCSSTAELWCSGAPGPVFTSHTADDTPWDWVTAPTWSCQQTRRQTPQPYPHSPSRRVPRLMRLIQPKPHKILWSEDEERTLVLDEYASNVLNSRITVGF